MSAIVIENIAKAFGPTQALQDVSFTVNPGELFGLIGPDGAGKTTLFKILVTLLLADKGQATVSGLNVVGDYKQLRHHIGYMPGRFSLYQDLSVQENLNFFATVFGTTIEANYFLIKDIYEQLAPFKDRRAGQLSGGMKQKLALCCALIHKPEVLFLDEPTTGVDAVSRKEFWEMLRRLKEQGLTILVSTPYMDEADLCDRVGFIQNGQILAIDTPEEITKRFTKPLYGVRAAETYRLIQDLRQAPFTDSCYAFGESLHLATHNGTDKRQIEQYLLDKQHQELEIERIAPGIEDTFMALMNQQTNEPVNH
ncbi:ABC transporter ATP-binding protein [Nibrella saemangeumensis]